ncbi:MAG: hypothetical protein EBX52_09295 [Proteobacteria bacterium]|nr:hypothetical protein [Pseudomonadota bacterium]
MDRQELTPERKKQLIRLALISAGLDLLLSIGEIPFMGLLPVTVTSEELAEAILSTLIAQHRLDLDFWDRLFGFLPIPGVTAITVRVFRELFL